MKVTTADIAKALDLDISDDPSKLTLSKGYFTLRREYYWRPRKTEQESFAPTVQKLQEAGFQLSDISYGDHYAAFRGGEGVKKNSHIWIKFKADRSE